MTELQRQAKEAADRLSYFLDWEGMSGEHDVAVNLLRRIERGELREVVYCYECSYAKETAVIICKNTDSPCRGSFLKGHDYCSFGRRKSDVP